MTDAASPSSKFDIPAMWREHFHNEIAEAMDRSDIPTTAWRCSGPTKRAPNAPHQNEDYWNTEGPALVDKYLSWREASGYKLWVTPDGRLANELALNPVFGEVPFKIFIDRVFAEPHFLVADLKTGVRTPDSDLQLGLAAVAIEKTYGVRPTLGGYYMARKGEMKTFTIPQYTISMVTDILAQFAAARALGIFIPNQSGDCFRCEARDYCAIRGGRYAADYDPLHESYRKESA